MKKKGFSKIEPYLYFIPIVLVMGIFKYIPFFTAMVKSLYRWNGTNIDVFVGLDNYITLFQDSMFWESVRHSFVIMFVYIAIVLTVPLLVAELLFAIRSDKAQYIIRTLFTFPMVVPHLVVILLWKWILAGENGLLNQLLEAVGLVNLVRPWLSDAETALGAILAIGFPWIGMAMVGGMQFLIYFGTLQSIPEEIFDATQIDGANVFERFRFVDLPLLSGQLRLMITLAIIQGLQMFDAVKILTNGGPGTATMVPTLLIYENAFTYKKMGYASAMGMVLFVIIMLLTVINNKFIKSKEEVTF